MDRELYRVLDLDFRLSKLNKRFELSNQFEVLHDVFITMFGDESTYFELAPQIKAKRKDQLLLNLQYNNLLYGYQVYRYEDYLLYAEEFFTYFLNYEMTTHRCSPQFPTNIRKVFRILNQFVRYEGSCD